MSILTVVVPVPVGSLNAQYEASRKLAEHTAECKILENTFNAGTATIQQKQQFAICRLYAIIAP